MLAPLLALCSWAWAAGTPRVVLETTAGDLVLALRPDVAPKQCERFLKLIKLGVYDSTALERVDATLYLRFSPAARRRIPLTDAQRRAVLEPRPPVEPGLPHDYGVVTVAHARGEDDATGTALAVLTARIPSMDGKFASFAVVERGQDVLEHLRGVTCGPDHAPIERVEIARAYALDAGRADARVLKGPPAPPAVDPRPGAIAIVLALAGLVLTRGKIARSLALLALLVGFFVAFAGLASSARATSWLGAALLAAAVAVFRLMASFEKAVEMSRPNRLDSR